MSHPSSLWWQKYGTLAQMAQASVALLGFVAILFQINEIRSSNRATSARQVFLGYTDMAFKNPKFEVLKDGEYVFSKNGGLTTCVVEVSSGVRVQIATFHMVPFHFFDVDLNTQPALDALSEVEIWLSSDAESRAIIQADFNINSSTLREYFPMLFAAGYNEILQTDPTTPRGKSLDHFIYKGLVTESTSVIHHCRTDHFPIVADFRESG